MCPGTCVPTCSRGGGCPARPPWCTCRGLGCFGGGGVVGREEGVGAVHHPVASWWVVVGGGEGVVQILHEGHVRGEGWQLVVGAGDVPRDVVPEVAQGGHPGDPCFPFPRFGVARGGAGWGVGHVALVVAGAALGVHPLGMGCPTGCRPHSMGGAKTRSPVGGGLSPSGVASGGRSCRATWWCGVCRRRRYQKAKARMSTHGYR